MASFGAVFAVFIRLVIDDSDLLSVSVGDELSILLIPEVEQIKIFTIVSIDERILSF